MKKYQYLFFDLDGTLTDSAPGIMSSIKYALEHFGVSIKSDQELHRYIGPPLLYSFKTYHGFSEEKSRQALDKFREKYDNGGVYDNEVYPEVENLLLELKKNGYKLYVATSKPEEMAKKVIEHFDLTKYFEGISGSSFDETRSEKTEVIKYCIEKNKITDIEKILMIGDRKYDIEGAHSNGLDCAAVLYGYGNRQEFEAASAEYIVESVNEIKNILI